MDCHDAKERLLEGRKSTGVLRHLDRCEDCAAFSRELAAGGRDVAESFLAAAPSPGFEERVARRLAEEEITIPIPIRPPGRLVRFLVPAVAVLLAVVAIRLFTGGSEPPAGSDGSGPGLHAAGPDREVTPPRTENVLHLLLRRRTSVGLTRLDLSFEGYRQSVTLEDDVEGALLRAWALGAQRARLVVGPRVPTREYVLVVEALETAGFTQEIVREKPPPGPASAPAR